ncbi:MAG: bifunctional (p)ppGpp synthetase/guanosine-3',5'-bis(diphosphate) 3'-pyrophosphohydrolase [Armatimonadetes bacterium]|nr:bifunctional (p)ppGpp synthetase/guanosine-3',5'-bis(diphosphate) 3'-pyrophosphohydrolase [Armatimonadota bacterium]
MGKPTTRLHEALVWAAQSHAGQDRDGESPLPYITHVVEVVNELRHTGGVTDETMLVAAVLHDIVESGGVSAGDVAKKFGTEVAGLVAELTRTEPTEEQMEGKSEREIWDMRSSLLLEDIQRMSSTAQTIKLADRISNFTHALRTKKGGKKKRYVKQTERILATVPRKTNSGLWKKLYGMVVDV